MLSYAQCDYLNSKYLEITDRAVFLDRDGTIHIDKINTHRIADLEYFPDTLSSIKKLFDAGYMIVIVTNQDGIAKKMYSKEEMSSFNRKIIKDFANYGIIISAIYFSPYQKDDNEFSFKPNPGMILQAEKDLKLNLSKCFLIGDQVHDSLCAKNANVPSILVKTGIYDIPITKHPDFKKISPLYIANNLSEACNFVLDHRKVTYVKEENAQKIEQLSTFNKQKI